METVPPAAEPTEDRPPDSAPAPLQELVAIACLVAVCDVTIYRGYGYGGTAALFVLAPILLALASAQRRFRVDFWIVGLMLAVLAATLLWRGVIGQVVLGGVLMVAFAMILAGMRPYVVDVGVYAVLALISGVGAVLKYLRSLSHHITAPIPRATWLKYILPLLAVLGFGTLFILANPDEAKRVWEWIEFAWNTIWESLHEFLPSFGELWFWLAVVWVAGGLLRPLVRYSIFAYLESLPTRPADQRQPVEIPLFAAYRNTLIALIGLFAVYLVFEFQTLWFREFPKGFHYSGYAHEGAAWLTVALALATAVLSGIFRANVLADSRIPGLRRLAWIWSIQNLLLATAVYHRMSIYIDFNGMTRMRVVGLLGITAVLVGFVLVVWKILHARDFVWLVNRQLWTLAAAIYLYAVLPVDPLIHIYNVRRILAGDPAPAVQITEHPVDSGGILVLHPLLNCSDETIREGIRAMLAERALASEETARRRALENWTSFQLADRLLLEQLRARQPDWQPYADAQKRTAAWERFREYAYQWY